MLVSHNKGVVIATRIVVVWGSVAVTLSRLVVVRVERVVRPWLAHGALFFSHKKGIALQLPAADDRSASQ